MLSLLIDNLERIRQDQEAANIRAAAGATLRALADMGVDAVEDFDVPDKPPTVKGQFAGILANYPRRRGRLVCVIRGVRVTIEET